MTGKELIIYILEQGLENEVVIKDGEFNGLWTINEEAVKLGCGRASIPVMVKMGLIEGIEVEDRLYVSPASVKKYLHSILNEME